MRFHRHGVWPTPGHSTRCRVVTLIPLLMWNRTQVEDTNASHDFCCGVVMPNAARAMLKKEFAQLLGGQSFLAFYNQVSFPAR